MRRSIWRSLRRVLCGLSYAISVHSAGLGYCEGERDPVYCWTWDYGTRVPCSTSITIRRSIHWPGSITVRMAERLVTAGKSAVRYQCSTERDIQLSWISVEAVRCPYPYAPGSTRESIVPCQDHHQYQALLIWKDCKASRPSTC